MVHKGIIKQQYTGVRIANCDPQECNQPWFSRVAAAMSEKSFSSARSAGWTISKMGPKYHRGTLKWTLAHSLVGAMSVETVKQIQLTDNTHHFIEKVARAPVRSN